MFSIFILSFFFDLCCCCCCFNLFERKKQKKQRKKRFFFQKFFQFLFSPIHSIQYTPFLSCSLSTTSQSLPMSMTSIHGDRPRPSWSLCRSDRLLCRTSRSCLRTRCCCDGKHRNYVAWKGNFKKKNQPGDGFAFARQSNASTMMNSTATNHLFAGEINEFLPKKTKFTLSVTPTACWQVAQWSS